MGDYNSSSSITLAQSAKELSKELVYENVDPIINSNNKKQLKIIHFNDVYNVESNNIEPKAGAARFVKAVDLVKKDSKENDELCLVLFSGDVFSPSSCNKENNLFDLKLCSFFFKFILII